MVARIGDRAMTARERSALKRQRDAEQNHRMRVDLLLASRQLRKLGSVLDGLDQPKLANSAYALSDRLKVSAEERIADKPIDEAEIERVNRIIYGLD